MRGKWRQRTAIGILSAAAVAAGLHVMLRVWWFFKVRNYYRLQEAHRVPAADAGE